MKTIKHLTCSLLATCSLLLTPCAFGAGSWAAINTAAYSGDQAPSTASAYKYEAYYCTKAAAQTMFGGTTVDAINAYLVNNFATGKAAMGTTEGSVAIDQQAYFAKNQYTFLEYYGKDVDPGQYLAVVFYTNDALEAFRVFGADNAVWDSGTLTFDDQLAGVGSWTTVPEPTSGMLLLLGLAGLALRRKRA